MSLTSHIHSKLLAALLLVTLLTAGFQHTTAGQGQANAPPAATDSATAAADYTGPWDGTLLFGAPLGLTGTLSKESNLSHEGYELWKTVYNKAGGIVVGGKHYQIDIKYYDDESDPKNSGTLADKLVKEEHVNFLLGPYGTSATLQVSAIAETSKIPLVEGNGVAESIFSKGYKYTFGVGSPAQNYLKGLVDMALAQTPKPATVAILSADDPFSVEVSAAAQKYADSKGLQVVYYEKYPNGATDIRKLLTDAKSKNPDLVLNSGHFAESIAIVQQAKELGLNAKGFGFSVGPSLPDFATTLKGDANFMLGGAQWTPDLQYKGVDLFQTPANYTKLYNAAFGHDPAYQSASATAAGLAYVAAIQQVQSIDPLMVRDALTKLDFVAFYGQIKFDERGVNIFKPMVVEQWQNGKKLTVWPSEVASGKPLWPAADWNAR